MPVSLSTNQIARIDKAAQLVRLGFRWDLDEYDRNYDFDVDLSAFICGANGKAQNFNDLVYYGNLNFENQAIWLLGDHMGLDPDNYMDGFDEELYIDFRRIPNRVERIVLVMTIYDAVSRGQNFGQVSNVSVHVDKLDSYFDTKGETLIEYKLKERFDQETALIVCEISRGNGEWEFWAVANGYQCDLKTLCYRYGVPVSE